MGDAWSWFRMRFRREIEYAMAPCSALRTDIAAMHLQPGKIGSEAESTSAYCQAVTRVSTARAQPYKFTKQFRITISILLPCCPSLDCHHVIPYPASRINFATSLGCVASYLFLNTHLYLHSLPSTPPPSTAPLKFETNHHGAASAASRG